jgi:hypothetical protein
MFTLQRSRRCTKIGANIGFTTEKAAHSIKDAVGAGVQQAKARGEEGKGDAAKVAGQGKGKAEEALGEAKGKTKEAMGAAEGKAKEAKNHM